MKNLLKVFLCTIPVLLSSVMAEAAWETAGDDLIRINVEVGSEYAGCDITFDVFAEGKTGEDVIGLNDTESIGIIVTREQDVLDENGSYSYIFGIDGDSGRYTAYISIGGMDDYIIEEIDFVNMAQFKSAIFNINENLKSSADYKEIGKIIDENAASFGLVHEEYEKFASLNHEKVAEIFVSMLEDDELTPQMRDEILNMIKKSVFVQSLNEGKISDIFGDLTLSELDNSKIQDWYNKDFVMESLKEDMTKRLTGQGFKSYDEYKNSLVAAYVLATVRYPNGYKNVKSVIKAFSEDIGLEYNENLSTDVWSGLSGKDFDDFDELCDTYKKLKSNKNPDGSSAGGSGGSKHTSKAPIYTDMVKEVQTDSKKKMDFDDVLPEHWAYSAVESLYNKSIINGRSDERFEPDGLITREEFVKLIAGCIDSEEGQNEITFRDVIKEAWYYDYIKKAYNLGIISGYTADVFGVGDFITRQDMAVIAYRVLKMSGSEATDKNQESFMDDDSISDYARESVYALRDIGIISGTPENEFLPKAFTTRAQAAMIIYNLLNEQNQEGR